MNTASTVNVATRTEARMRTESGESSLAKTSDSALELEVAPTAQYTVAANGAADYVTAIYVPRFILPDTLHPAFGNAGDRKSRFSTFHNGGFALGHTRPKFRLDILALGAIGSINTAALLNLPPWRGDRLPETPLILLPAERSNRFTVAFYQIQATPTFRLDAKWSLTPMVRFNAFGGADSQSRATLPLTRGPQTETRLAYKATRRMTFTTFLGAAYTTVLAAQIDVAGQVIGDRQGAPVSNAAAEQSLGYKTSRHGEVEVGLGGTVAQVRTQGVKVSPVGHAQFVHRTPHAKWAIVLKQAPWLNLFAGEYEPRTELTVAAHVDLDKHWVVRGQASAIRTLGKLESVSRYTFLVGDTAVGYRLTDETLLEGGARAGLQDMTNALFDSRTLQIVGFATFTYAPRHPHRL
jgi:hypothetical protein